MKYHAQTPNALRSGARGRKMLEYNGEKYERKGKVGRNKLHCDT